MKYLGEKSASSFLKTVLNLAWYLGIAAAVLLVLSQLYLLFASPPPFSGNIIMQIEVPGMVFRFTDGLSEPISLMLFVLQFTLVLPLLAIGLFVLYQLRKIFATLVDAAPFTSENGRRMRFIGIAVIAGTLMKAILNILLGIYLSNIIHLPGLELNANIRAEDFAGVFLGAIILILGEVFRQGAILQEEQDLTV